MKLHMLSVKTNSVVICILGWNTNFRYAILKVFIFTFRIYPDYYEEIEKPISLLNIKNKLKAGRYHALDKMADDMDLVFENAKSYNLDESLIHKVSLVLNFKHVMTFLN